MHTNVLVHCTSDGTLNSLEIKCVIRDHFFLITKTAAAETFSNLLCFSGVRYDLPDVTEKLMQICSLNSDNFHYISKKKKTPVRSKYHNM